MGRLALAAACGAAVSVQALPHMVPIGAALGLLLLIRASTRPTGLLWIAAVGIGATGPAGGPSPGCVPADTSGTVAVQGRFLAPATYGSAPLELLNGCGPFTVVLSDSTVDSGTPVQVEGRWESGRMRPWFRASVVRRIELESGPGLVERARWSAVRWRATLLDRIVRLYGDRAPLVSALTLARREGLDPELRDLFARAGIAHLLAISGFHVGVLAASALAILRLCRVPRRPARLAAAVVCCAYVVLIGAPSAAARAGLIVFLSAVSVWGGRRPARWGPIGSAFLLLIAFDPSDITAAGFQLSFLGAAGLVAWSRPWSEALAKWGQGKIPRGLSDAVATGTAATVATLPAVAWHFEQVSLVGVPVTLFATPLVSTALPGAVLSVVLEPWFPAVAALLAGGVDLLLVVLEAGTTWIGSQSWASVWVSPMAVGSTGVGIGIGALMARHPRIGRRGRHRLMAVYGLCAVIAWPLYTIGFGWGRVTTTFLDVGQGDAILLRSPNGRFVLIDTGTPWEGDAASSPVVRALRQRGVRRLEALVLTHPDADHIGGAEDVLRSVRVAAVIDPALIVGKGQYASVLATARAHRVPWLAATDIDAWDLGRMELTVRYPTASLDLTTEVNEASVVLTARFGDFSVLLTGDAGKDVERELLPTLGRTSILKVGHHGSDTSTGEPLLARAQPDVAVISVGRRNRYGHPHPAVLARLRDAGATIYRTDDHGDVTVRGRADGSYSITVERGAEPENRR